MAQKPAPMCMNYYKSNARWESQKWELLGQLIPTYFWSEKWEKRKNTIFPGGNSRIKRAPWIEFGGYCR